MGMSEEDDVGSNVVTNAAGRELARTSLATSARLLVYDLSSGVGRPVCIAALLHLAWARNEEAGVARARWRSLARRSSWRRRRWNAAHVGNVASHQVTTSVAAVAAAAIANPSAAGRVARAATTEPPLHVETPRRPVRCWIAIRAPVVAVRVAVVVVRAASCAKTARAPRRGSARFGAPRRGVAPDAEASAPPSSFPSPSPSSGGDRAGRSAASEAAAVAAVGASARTLVAAVVIVIMMGNLAMQWVAAMGMVGWARWRSIAGDAPLAVLCAKAPDVGFCLPGFPWDLTQIKPHVARSR